MADEEFDAALERARPEREGAERKYMSELGRRIRSAREQRGMTQRQAAEAAGIATDMISRIENGHYQSPGLRTLLRIAEGLGARVSELLPEASEASKGRAEELGAQQSLRARLDGLSHRLDARELELVVAMVEAVLTHRA